MEKHVQKIAHRSIVDGKWIRDSYEVTINGKQYDFRDLAKDHGIKLDAKAKKQVNTNADMGKTLDSGHTEIDRDRDSKSEE